MPLGALFSEFSGAPLISQLHKSKRRLEPVHKHDLDILLIDGCIDLVKHLDEKNQKYLDAQIKLLNTKNEIDIQNRKYLHQLTMQLQEEKNAAAAAERQAIARFWMEYHDQKRRKELIHEKELFELYAKRKGLNFGLL